MNTAISWRVAPVVLIACLSACLGSYSRAVEETRAGLLGLEGRDLRNCLGVPTDFEIDGDLEHQTYRFERDDLWDDRIGSGGIGGAEIGRYPPVDRRYDPHEFPIDERDRSYCQLDFELSEGRVTRVLAQGRTREGMNADASCMLRAQRCLPYEYE